MAVRLCHQENGFQIHRENFVPLFLFDLFQLSRMRDSRVVDEDVDATESFSTRLPADRSPMRSLTWSKSEERLIFNTSLRAKASRNSPLITEATLARPA